MGDPLSRGSEPPKCPGAGEFHYTMPAQFGYLQRGLSRHGEAESRESRRDGEHHQLQDFLLSWLRFPCLYIAPSCHSLWAHSWEETAGRTDGEDAGLCPAEPGWLPAPAQAAARLATPAPGCTRSLPSPEDTAPRVLHVQLRPWIPPAPPVRGARVQMASGWIWVVVGSRASSLCYEDSTSVELSQLQCRLRGLGPGVLLGAGSCPSVT